MAKLKFKNENGEFIPVVQDVKVNGTSVFNEETANIKLKTINNQSIVGTGNIEIESGGGGEYVEYSPNQDLTLEQQENARENINAVGNNQIKQTTGNSTTDVMSQKAVSTALNNKQDVRPDGRHTLINSDTNKIDSTYLPSISTPVTSVNGYTGDIYLTPEDIGATTRYWGWENKYKNLVTNENGEVVLNDYPLGQIIVNYYSDLPNVNPNVAQQNIPQKAKATVLQSEDIEHRYTEQKFQDSIDNHEPLENDLMVRPAPERPYSVGQKVNLYDNNHSFYVSYSTDLTNDASFYILDTQTQEYYVFSWIKQGIVYDNNVEVYADTWTKVYEVNNNWVSEEYNWGDIPKLNYPVYVDSMSLHEDNVFVTDFVYFESKNAGDYIYEEVTPQTYPPTYQWYYVSNQIDWLSGDIVNKPEITPYGNNIWVAGKIRCGGGGYNEGSVAVPLVFAYSFLEQNWEQNGDIYILQITNGTHPLGMNCYVTSVEKLDSNIYQATMFSYDKLPNGTIKLYADLPFDGRAILEED